MWDRRYEFMFVRYVVLNGGHANKFMFVTLKPFKKLPLLSISKLSYRKKLMFGEKVSLS